MNCKLTLSALALTVLCAARAGAAISTESSTFNNVAIGAAPFIVNLNKFNPSLGALQSVEFKLELFNTNAGTLTFDNEGAALPSVTLNLGVDVKAKTGVALITTAELNPSTRGSGPAGADSDAAPDFIGSDIFSINSGVLSGSNSTLRTASNFLTQFTQQGNPHTYQVTISNLRTTSSSSLAGPTQATGGTFSGRISAIYTYGNLPIPEGSTALFGICLGVLASARRLRMRRGV
jgi:hypothetical protein